LNNQTFFAQYPKLTKVLELDSSTFVSIEPLSGGLTNQCFKLTLEENAYVWRPYSEFNKKLGYGRIEEHDLLHYLQTLVTDTNTVLPFISPRVKLINSEGLLVEWLNGRTFDAIDQIQPLANCLYSLHQIDITHSKLKQFDIFEKITVYWQAISDKSVINDIATLHKNFGQCSERFQQPSAQSMIHLDLGYYNLIETEQGIGVIDWEYAAIGNPVFDLVLTSLANDIELTKLCACYAQLSENTQQPLCFNRLIEESLLWLPTLKYMAMLWYILGYEHYNGESYLISAQTIATDLRKFK
jgi:thiamine kinase